MSEYKPEQTLGDLFRSTVEAYRLDEKDPKLVRQLADGLFIALVSDRAERSSYTDDRRADEHMADIRTMIAEYNEFKTEGIADED